MKRDTLEGYYFINEYQGKYWGYVSKRVGADYYLVKYGMPYMNPEGGGDEFSLVPLDKMQDWHFYPNEKEYNKACDLIQAKAKKLNDIKRQRRTA